MKLLKEDMDDWLVIENVIIPLELGDTFIPPDLIEALEYYSTFEKYVRTAWSIQAYLCQIMKEIDKRKPNGFDGDTAVQELISYVGGVFEFGKLLGIK